MVFPLKNEIGRLDTVASAAADIIPILDVSADDSPKRTTVAELKEPKVFACGSALTMSEATHSGGIILLDTATGSTATLPAVSRIGATYTFIVSALATSNNHIIKVANASDAMQGTILSVDDTSDNTVGFKATAGTSDTITLNRTTTGSVTVGERITITAVAANRYQVDGVVTNTGTPATQFSATVS